MLKLSRQRILNTDESGNDDVDINDVAIDLGSCGGGGGISCDCGGSSGCGCGGGGGIGCGCGEDWSDAFGGAMTHLHAAPSS